MSDIRMPKCLAKKPKFFRHLPKPGMMAKVLLQMSGKWLCTDCNAVNPEFGYSCHNCKKDRS